MFWENLQNPTIRSISYYIIPNIPFVIYYILNYVPPFVNLLLIEQRTGLVVWPDSPEYMVGYIVGGNEGWHANFLKGKNFVCFVLKKDHSYIKYFYVNHFSNLKR